MKRSQYWLGLIVGIVLITLFKCILDAIPLIAPSFAWRTKWAYLQLPAIEHLMRRLHVGMTSEEMVDVMGTPDGMDANPPSDASGVYSYNVNFDFNCGIDIHLEKGRIISIMEYN